MPIPEHLRGHIDNDGRISRLPVKLSKKQELALGLLQEIEFGERYSETQINEILSRSVVDFAMIRRMLVSSGFLGRDRYGREYQRLEPCES
jgi:hypothetical protein